MRKDLAKVICERERRGSASAHKCNRNKEFNTFFKPDRKFQEDDELDCLPQRHSYRAPSRTNWNEDKDFSDRLGAIRGLIRKSVGRRWNDVYSEICKVFPSTGGTVIKHVHQHLMNYIETKCVLNSKGEVCTREVQYRGSSAPFLCPVNGNRRSRSGPIAYVDPRDGIIKLVKYAVAPKEPSPEQVRFNQYKIVVIVPKSYIAVELKGVWYGYNLQEIKTVREVTSCAWSPTGTRTVTYQIPKDELGLATSSWRPYGPHRAGPYGIDGYAATNKRQLSSKEIKQWKLRDYCPSI